MVTALCACPFHRGSDWFSQSTSIPAWKTDPRTHPVFQRIPVGVLSLTLTMFDLLAPSVLAILSAFALYYLSRRSIVRPPGPRGFPLIGNALQMPYGHEWLRYAQWGAQYGDSSHQCTIRVLLISVS